MDQVITFDKSFQTRSNEYKDIFTSFEITSVTRLQKEWAFYLELTLDSIGWQAIWKISRKTCEHYGIPFPTVVLVLVLSVDFEELTGLVRILAVQGDIHLPKKHYASLTELWPTKDQDRSIALNLESTANALDALRFFYNNLLMPWDLDDEESSDWTRKHLESRLRLYYDMKNGMIPRETAEHLRCLLTEAKHLLTKRKDMESDLQEDEDNELDLDNQNDAKVGALAEIHLRIVEIKNEVEVLENPLLRTAMFQRLEREKSHHCTKPHKNIWMIFDEGHIDDYLKFLNTVQQEHPTDIVKFANYLAPTLEGGNSGDVYILSESNHFIKSAGALETGGILKGISNRNSTMVTSSQEQVMLDFQGEVVLQNITINAATAQCAIVVRRGRLVLKNCKIIGDGKSSTHQGILVLSGASLEIENCDISLFYTAIVGNSGASITIINSEIHDVGFGLKAYDNCAVKASNSLIRNCRDYGICIETEAFEEGSKSGSFNILNLIPHIQIESMKGDNNFKDDAIIKEISKLIPVENLFLNPDLDPTICEDSSDEEMDVHNQTVIENGRLSPATI